MSIKISNSTISDIIVKIFKKHNISNICISPGSRNIPLIKAFTLYKFFNNYSHIDERSAAFFALGASKAANTPAVVITTSGTAVANLLPAVIESDLSKTPLIIISADRPKNLINTGENQTINQNGIFDNFIRKKIQLESPVNSFELIIKKIDAVVNAAKGDNDNKASGPVHINIAFDEPLLDKNINNNYKITIFKSNKSTKPKKINLPDFKKPLIICGQSRIYNFDKIVKLSTQLNAPILADTISQTRLWKKHNNIICHYDFYIDQLNIKPDLIIRFGKKPTSKKLNHLLKKYKNKTWLISDDYGYNDDAPNTAHHKDLILNYNSDKSWLKYLKEIDNQTALLLRKNSKTIFFEGNIIFSLIDNLSKNDTLIVGNSLTVRNLEKYCHNVNKKIKVFSNRGASGIDGIISTAMGIASSKNSNSRNILILGDVSFFYDISALLLNQNKINLTVIVINNKGGQIFTTINYDSKIEKFKRFMTTPVNMKIKDLCKASKINYYNIKSINMINSKLNTIIDKKGIQIIEILCDIKTTVNIERKINRKIKLII